MPIKFSKGFARRKSSGNLLEDVAPPAEPSFRVLDRRERENHVFGESNDKKSKPKQQQQKPTQALTQSPEERAVTAPVVDGRERSPNDSVGRRTYNSNSTTGGVSSNDRFSNGSTRPSSVETPQNSQNELLTNSSSKLIGNELLDQVASPKNRIPPAPQPNQPQDDWDARPKTATSTSSKKSKTKKSRTAKDSDDFSGERLFSFGKKASQSQKSRAAEEDIPPVPTMSSYSSSASPPKLDLGLDVQGDENGGIEGGLAYILSSLGKRTSTIMEEPHMSSPQQAMNRSTSDYTAFMSNSASNLERNASRRSWDSQRSQEVFSTSHRLKAKASNLSSKHGYHLQEAQEEEEEVDTNMFDVVYASQTLANKYGTQVRNQNSMLNRPRMNSDVWVQPQNSIRGQFVYGSNAPPYTANTNNNNNNYRKHNATTLQAPAPPRAAGKVLSGREFEALRQKGPETAPEEDQSVDSDESENYEDEDDVERQQKMVRMRRKQEANLAVYRQQMMKVTGDTPGELPTQNTIKRPLGRNGVERSTVSLPSFPEFNINTAKKSVEVQEKTSDDSDDDVPLGVLQAHGFPSRTRPPTRLSTSGADIKGFLRPNSQMSLHPTRQQPTVGIVSNTPNNALPAFARDLPQDPYVGASLVHQSNREPLPYTNSGSGVAAATAQANSGGPLPPGGLIGVIAGEELARARRRGSPNQPGNYGHHMPAMAAPQSLPHSYSAPHLGVPMDMHQQEMMMATQAGAADSAQAPMSAQMTQMMQIQMQWMQQMQQMQQIQQMMQSQGLQMPPNVMPPPLQQFQQQQLQQQQGQYLGNAFAASQSMNNLSQRPRSSADVGRPPMHERSSSSLSMSRPMAAYGNGKTLSVFGDKRSASAQSVMGIPMGGQAYAASIAPSERSNIGQPSRYRPVNTAAPASGRNSRRPSVTFVNNSRSTPSPLNGSAKPSVDLMRGTGPLQKSKSSDAFRSASTTNLLLPTIKVAERMKNNNARAHEADEDDEDEQGWEEMRKKRAARTNKWSQTSLSAIAASSRPVSTSSSGTAGPKGIDHSTLSTSSPMAAAGAALTFGDKSQPPTPVKFSQARQEISNTSMMQNGDGFHDSEEQGEEEFLPEGLYYEHTGFEQGHEDED